VKTSNHQALIKLRQN